jgi:hypothetical protein
MVATTVGKRGPMVAALLVEGDDIDRVEARYGGGLYRHGPRATGGAVRRGSVHNARWALLQRPLGTRATGDSDAGWVSAWRCWLKAMPVVTGLTGCALSNGGQARGHSGSQWAGARERSTRAQKGDSDKR